MPDPTNPETATPPQVPRSTAERAVSDRLLHWAAAWPPLSSNGLARARATPPAIELPPVSPIGGSGEAEPTPEAGLAPPPESTLPQADRNSIATPGPLNFDLSQFLRPARGGSREAMHPLDSQGEPVASGSTPSAEVGQLGGVLPTLNPTQPSGDHGPPIGSGLLGPQTMALPTVTLPTPAPVLALADEVTPTFDPDQAPEPTEADATSVAPPPQGDSGPRVRPQRPDALLASFSTIGPTRSGRSAGGGGPTPNSELSDEDVFAAALQGGGSEGGTASSTGASSPELGPTNELLQQILDVLRNNSGRSGSPLPNGGGAVYAGRD